MRIKNHKNGNEYLQTASGIWVRNFTKTSNCQDINTLIKKDDFSVFLNNEISNSRHQFLRIDDLQIQHPNVVIVSDGYGFKEKQQIISKLKGHVIVLAVNSALRKWNLSHKGIINYYVVNNPYHECLSYLPTKHAYFPKCITSTRTHYKFVEKYRGYLYRYVPVPQANYRGTDPGCTYKIDDYRNPICAAIGLSFHFGVKKLLLLCCDDSFKDNRPGTEKLENEFHMYPQHRIAHDVIDGNLYWLKNQEITDVEIKDHSCGPKYANAAYIQEEDICDFFNIEGA